MDPNKIANDFETFVRSYPMSLAIIVALLLGWTATSFVKPFLVGRTWKPSALRLIDFGVAFSVTARMWPSDHRFIWALLVGTGSPTVYWIGTSVLCWKRPALKKYLTLKELEPESDETGTEAQVPPPGV